MSTYMASPASNSAGTAGWWNGPSSWLTGTRRLHRRYERRSDHFGSFVALATALIRYRLIAK
jgi:hypothetical protein